MAFRVSNDLYENDVMYASVLEKRYTRPLQIGPLPAKIPTNLFSAHHTLSSKRNLILILRSKFTRDTPVHPGDRVQIFITKQHEKRGSRKTGKPLITIEVIPHPVTVPNAKVRTIKAAVGDVRHVIVDDESETAIQGSIDELAIHLDTAVGKPVEDICEEVEVPAALSYEHNVLHLDESDETDAIAPPSIGDKISVFWPDKTSSALALSQAFLKVILQSSMSTTTIATKKCSMITQKREGMPQTQLSAHMTRICSNEIEHLRSFYAFFKHKDFMRFQAQGFPFHMLRRVCTAEERTLKQTLKVVPRVSASINTNIISGHLI